MHIVQIINALRVGGAEKLIVTFAQAIQHQNNRLTIVTLRPNVPAVQAQVESFGARVMPFNHRKPYAIKRFWGLLRYLRASAPDVIHTHLSMANILGASAGALAGIPVVSTLHNTRMSTRENIFLSTAETFLLGTIVARIIAVGWQTAKVQQPRFGSKHVDVIPNAVPIPEKLSPNERECLRRELIGDPTLPLLISVCRLEPQKGIFDLLDAFTILHKDRPDAHLVIAGSGSLEGNFRSAVAERGLGDMLHLIGLRQDIPYLLGASDVFVSAAHWEGLPLSTLEAMAVGLPVVVTAVGDLPRVLQDGTGILVDAHNPALIAKQLDLLIDSPERRSAIGNAARSLIKREYSAPVWADRLLNVYHEVARDQPAQLIKEKL